MANSTAKFRMPMELWSRMHILVIDDQKPSPKGGRPRKTSLKPIADGIFYKLRTGCQWNSIPRCYGASSTIHDYFKRWTKSGVFSKLWDLALEEYDELVGVSWAHQSIDSASVKAPLGGKKNRTESHRQRKVRLQEVNFGGRSRSSGIVGACRSEHS